MRRVSLLKQETGGTRGDAESLPGRKDLIIHVFAATRGDSDADVDTSWARIQNSNQEPSPRHGTSFNRCRVHRSEWVEGRVVGGRH